jgi:hypothetical protein
VLPSVDLAPAETFRDDLRRGHFSGKNWRLFFAKNRANIGEIAKGDADIKAGIRADEAIYAFFLEISPTSSNRDEIPHPF